MLGARRALASLLATRDADVLNVYQPLSGYGVLTSPAGRRVPTLYSFMSPAPLEYRSRRRMTANHRAGVVGLAGVAGLWLAERVCLRRSARVQVLSDFSASLLWKLYRLPAERLVKISGGVDVEHFQPAPDRREVRAALGLPLDRPIALTVRNLEARMGLDRLIEAMATLVRHVPDVLLLIGGSGSQRAALDALVRARGLDKHVTFLGFIPEGDLPRHYQAADVFVLPTRELEGFGLVTAEALACGTPVLGTPVGATPELLEPLDAGLVFRDATAAAMAEDLAALLTRLAADPAAAARLRTACRTYAEAQFGWEHVVDDLERTLRDIARGVRTEPTAAGACEACGGALRASRLVYGGRRYARCRRCGARRVVTLPTRARRATSTRCATPAASRPARSIRPAARCWPASRPGRAGRPHPDACWTSAVAAATSCWPPAPRAGDRSAADLSHAACVTAHRAGAGPAVGADAEALPFGAGDPRRGRARQRAGPHGAAAHGRARGGAGAAAGRPADRAGAQRRLPPEVGATAGRRGAARAVAGLGRLPDPAPVRLRPGRAAPAGRGRGLRGARHAELGAGQPRAWSRRARAGGPRPGACCATSPPPAPGSSTRCPVAAG